MENSELEIAVMPWGSRELTVTSFGWLDGRPYAELVGRQYVGTAQQAMKTLRVFEGETLQTTRPAQTIPISRDELALVEKALLDHRASNEETEGEDA